MICMKKFVCVVLAAFGLAACSVKQTETVPTPSKQLHPWVVYGEESSFADLEPVKDMIASVSVFGNPPREYIDKCHAAGIEVYRAVGGNEESINTPEKIASLVESYVNDCQANGYDGIDLDFEHLSPSVRATYSDFLQKASAALHAAGKKMSHCVGFYPALYADENTQIFYDPAVLENTCDLVRVMCYDMYCAPCIGVKELAHRDDCQGVGPTSNYLWTRECMLYWKERISADKLVMALPAYGNDYKLTGDITGTQIYAPKPDKAVGELPAPTWLCYEKVNMYLYDHEDGCRHLFYAADARSTECLLQLADELQLPKVGFWHFSSVSPDTWKVTRDWMEK